MTAARRYSEEHKMWVGNVGSPAGDRLEQHRAERELLELVRAKTRGLSARDIVDRVDHPSKVAPFCELNYRDARRNFRYFRKLMDPSLIECWWQNHAANRLQQFYHDMLAGLRPKLILDAPPQHGKSRLLRDFSSWVAGKNPDAKIMFASYSDDLGTAANLHLQRTMAYPCYRGTFPGTKIATRGEGWQVNTGLIEWPGHLGSFRNTTVRGAINGFGLDLGIVDDPIKGQEESRSKTVRDKTWEWFTNDLFLRFADHAGLVMIMTRWHVDDPVGRWLDKFPETQVLKYAAIADEDDWTVTEGLRPAGDPLFSESKPLDFLLERKKLLTQAAWLALYQQSPIVVGGGILPVEKLRVIPVLPPRDKIRRSVRYVDKGGTAGGGAYTAMVLMSMLDDGRFLIEDVVRGQWSALDREETLLRVAQSDRDSRRGQYEVVVEQEPGSGGKESAEATIRNLRGFRCFADKVTGSKETRAEPFAAQVQGNNVWMVAGAWVMPFLDEAEAWPNGKYRDQIDAAAGAFNRMTAKPVYNLDAMA